MSGSIDGQQTLPLGARHSRSRAPRAVLLILHRDGAETVALGLGERILIGRSAPSTIVLGDEELSRQHASFELADDGVRVADLGSTNGTWMNGERIERAILRPGEQVVLGAVVVSLHVQPGGDAPLTGLTSHDLFVRRGEEEVVRAKYFGRPFAIAMVETSEPTSAGIGRWCLPIQDRLRPVDAMGIYSASIAEILLPEITLADASRMAGELAEGGLRFAVAGYPICGTTFERLVDVCRQALRETTAANPVSVAPTIDQRLEQRGAALRDARPVVESGPMQQLFETVQRVAQSAIPVLLHGETGVGKEVIARAIHESGPRRDRPLVFVNCGAIPSQLVESTLFGHVKGAFTGAVQSQKGVFESADGGTVMLDELGELPPSAQAALLRVLETKRVTRVGSTTEVAVDARMIAATHRDLEEMCDKGTFRWDLFYRLNGMTLTIPPLRSRRDDILPLAHRFLAEAAASTPGHIQLELEPDAQDALLRYEWPGNVRELKNAMERATVIARGNLIALEDLPARICRAAERGDKAPAPSDAPQPTRAGAEAQEGAFKDRMQRFERDLLLDALNAAGGSQTGAARALSMPLRTFIHKMKAHGIRREYVGED